MKYIKEIQCVSCPSIPPFSFAHLATNQRRSNEFYKESIYIPVRSCYNIFMVDENGVVRARKKERDTQGKLPESVIRICNISPGKDKIIGKISIK